MDGIITQGLLLNSFPGITYFIQHLLVAFVFVAVWAAFVGFDKTGLIIGSVMLALLWVVYGMFLGPVGLPGPSPHYLGYSDLWYKSFPGVLISSLIAFALTTRFTPQISKLLLAVVILFLFTIFSPQSVYAAEGLPASVMTRGEGKMVVGADPYNLNSTQPMNGSIQMQVVNVGDRWSPLMNVDEMNIVSEFTSGGSRYRITIDKPMVKHPLGKYTTWFGVAYRQRMHGNTGIGTNKLPDVVANVAVWGFAQIEKDGQTIAKMAPAHIMVMREGPIKGITLEVDAEDKALQGVDNGYLHVMWPNIDTLNLSTSEADNRRWLGWLIFVATSGIFWYLINKEPSLGASRSASVKK